MENDPEGRNIKAVMMNNPEEDEIGGGEEDEEENKNPSWMDEGLDEAEKDMIAKKKAKYGTATVPA